MSGDLEQFNAHQQDTSNRGTALVKAILLIAGGALTVSIGTFAKNDSPQMMGAVKILLQLSWFGLIGAILLLVTSLVIIIARDYSFGERWRIARRNKRPIEKEVIVWVEVMIWGAALFGYILFVLGMLGLAVVAASVVGPA
ncbi:hypothetical protein KZO85_07770 [Chromohalobacter canadensis]|uniref:hypothetical protein n=1 Tax=Chromohalobacter canadensis TaxID=141389 RepID=UPI0021BF1CA4|nr:hypothetical protein [Chromohalobacter canadensis]MCT8468469.1 hypothetical protein [Chromohalobacter canadensis]MCT8471524.1 hypothetical protein [Chromohalobacter canadensis]MCT8498977.1 hypothetical protein [Chromohalobacter canadensis]